MTSRKRTVLLVEDEPDSRQLMRAFLEEAGLSVIPAADGKSALRQLLQGTFDLVCLDLVLPELSGYEVCEFMRRVPRLRKIPVLVVSARGLPEDRAWANELGASGYVTKPFTERELIRQVRALLTLAAIDEAAPYPRSVSSSIAGD